MIRLCLPGQFRQHRCECCNIGRRWQSSKDRRTYKVGNSCRLSRELPVGRCWFHNNQQRKHDHSLEIASLDRWQSRTKVFHGFYKARPGDSCCRYGCIHLKSNTHPRDEPTHLPQCSNNLGLIALHTWNRCFSRFQHCFFHSKKMYQQCKHLELSSCQHSPADKQ